MNVVSDLNSAIAIFLLFGPLLILVLFLPALIELKRPKDEGPRFIMNRLPAAKIGILKTIVFKRIVDIDEEERFEVLLYPRVAEITGIMSNFES